MTIQQFHQIEGCGHSYTQGILELLIGTFVYPLHQWQGIVDDDIHSLILAQNLCGKCLQNLFPGDVSNEVLSLLFVNHINHCSLIAELIGNASTNTIGTTSNYDYFIFERICLHRVKSTFISSALFVPRPRETYWRSNV